MWRLLALGSNWEKKVLKRTMESLIGFFCLVGKMGFDEWFDSLVVELKGHVFSKCHALDYLWQNLRWSPTPSLLGFHLVWFWHPLKPYDILCVVDSWHTIFIATSKKMPSHLLRPRDVVIYMSIKFFWFFENP